MRCRGRAFSQDELDGFEEEMSDYDEDDEDEDLDSPMSPVEFEPAPARSRRMAPRRRPRPSAAGRRDYVRCWAELSGGARTLKFVL